MLHEMQFFQLESKIGEGCYINAVITKMAIISNHLQDNYHDAYYIFKIINSKFISMIERK